MCQGQRGPADAGAASLCGTLGGLPGARRDVVDIAADEVQRLGDRGPAVRAGWGTGVVVQQYDLWPQFHSNDVDHRCVILEALSTQHTDTSRLHIVNGRAAENKIEYRANAPPHGP